MKKVLIILSIIFVSAFLFCGSVSAATGSGINTQPLIKSVNPANNAVNVPLNKVIKVTFNKPIKLGTKPWIELKNTRWGSKPFTANTSSNVLYITTKSILAYGTEYYVVLHSNSIKDPAGNGLASPYKFKFKTGIGLKVTSTIPINNVLNIPTTKLIKITFNKPIKNPLNSLIQLKSILGTNIPITFSITKNSLYIYHSPLEKNTIYKVTLKPNCIRDHTGNGLLNTYTTTFKTGNSLLEYNFPNVYLKARLSIPKLGVKCFIRSDTVNAYNAVYHYSNSVYPGKSGECGLMGHRTTYSKLFRYINLLKIGDLVTIQDYAYEMKYSYRVVFNGDIRWDYESNPITFKKWGQSFLLLVSCHPPGSSAAAWITHCKLVSAVHMF